MRNIYYIGKADLTIEDIEWIITNNIKLELSDEAKERIQKCRTYLDEKMERAKAPIYGINTGFGSLCDRSISKGDLSALQENFQLPLDL